jgi:hypothetical protein
MQMGAAADWHHEVVFFPEITLPPVETEEEQASENERGPIFWRQHLVAG